MQLLMENKMRNFVITFFFGFLYSCSVSNKDTISQNTVINGKQFDYYSIKSASDTIDGFFCFERDTVFFCKKTKNNNKQYYPLFIYSLKGGVNISYYYNSNKYKNCTNSYRIELINKINCNNDTFFIFKHNAFPILYDKVGGNDSSNLLTSIKNCYDNSRYFIVSKESKIINYLTYKCLFTEDNCYPYDMK